MENRDHLQALLQSVAEQASVATLEKLGITSGEMSANHAIQTYGKLVKSYIKTGRLKPSRTGAGKNGTKWFRVQDILKLKAEDAAEHLNITEKSVQ